MVLVVIVVVAAIAIPKLLRSRMGANEAGAVEAMRMISTGELAFQTAAFVDADSDGIGDYGTLLQLAEPDTAGATPPYIDAVLGGGGKDGYNYTVSVTLGSAVSMPAYTCTAVPVSSGRTGYRQYYVDRSGVIRFTADGTTVNAASAPLN